MRRAMLSILLCGAALTVMAAQLESLASLTTACVLSQSCAQDSPEPALVSQEPSDLNDEPDSSGSLVEFLTLLPESTQGIIGIGNVQRLTHQGDWLIQQTDPDRAADFSLVNLYQLVVNMLNLGTGITDQGSAALFVVGPLDFMSIENLVLAIPLGDRNELAKRLRVDAEQLADNQIVVIDRLEQVPVIRAAMVRDSHLLLAGSAKPLKNLLADRSLKDSLPETLLNKVDRDDLFFFFRNQADNRVLQDLKQALRADAQQRINVKDEVLARYERLLDQVDYLWLSVRIDSGLEGTVQLGFEGEESARWLAEHSDHLRTDEQRSATFGSSDPLARLRVGKYRSELLPLSFSLASRFIVNTQRMDALRLTHWASPLQSPLLLELNEGVTETDLRIERQENGGQYAIALALYSDAPAAQRDRMRELAQFVSYGRLAPDAFREAIAQARVDQLIAELGASEFDVRERATNRLRLIARQVQDTLAKATEADDLEQQYRARMILEELKTREAQLANSVPSTNPWEALDAQFKFYERAEEIAGRELDVVGVEVIQSEVQQQDWLASLFGDDWNRWRLYQADDHLQLLIGSDSQWLERQLTPSTASSGLEATSNRFERRAGNELWAKMEVSFHRFMNPEAVSAQTEPTQLGISIHGDSVSVDWFVPQSDLKPARTFLYP